MVAFKKPPPPKKQNLALDTARGARVLDKALKGSPAGREIRSFLASKLSHRDYHALKGSVPAALAAHDAKQAQDRLIPPGMVPKTVSEFAELVRRHMKPDAIAELCAALAANPDPAPEEPKTDEDEHRADLGGLAPKDDPESKRSAPIMDSRISDACAAAAARIQIDPYAPAPHRKPPKSTSS